MSKNACAYSMVFMIRISGRNQVKQVTAIQMTEASMNASGKYFSLSSPTNCLKRKFEFFLI